MIINKMSKSVASSAIREVCGNTLIIELIEWRSPTNQIEKYELSVRHHNSKTPDNESVPIRYRDYYSTSTFLRRKDFDNTHQNISNMIKANTFNVEHGKGQIVLTWRYKKNEYVSETKGYVLEPVQ
jgi:hypothetical protein